MDKALRAECAALRRMTSAEACNWLILKCDQLPQSISHRSWLRPEQDRLLEFYTVGKLPFAHLGPYEVLIKISSVRKVAETIEKQLGGLFGDELVLLYYFLPNVLRKHARTQKESDVVETLIGDLDALLRKTE